MKKLTVAKLKELNPDLYAQCVNIGFDNGVKQERARCVSKLPAYVNDKAAKYAIQCVKNGESLGNSQKAMYMTITLEANKKSNESEQIVSFLERKFGAVDDGYKRY